nr:ATP-binding protein [Prosthecochloris ethylica]
MIITGPTGAGKTWLACAFGVAACTRKACAFEIDVSASSTSAFCTRSRSSRSTGSISHNTSPCATISPAST